jgi:fructosamine-3-kinase
MTAELRDALAAVLGESVRALRQLAGGDINDAYCATLGSGKRVFVKTRADAPPGMYLREAEGLGWLAEASALRVPEVLAVDDRLLVLPFIERGARAADFDEQLGRGLALLHRAGAPCFGLGQDNFIANLPQANGPLSSFGAFYRERRLAPMCARAAAKGLLTTRDLRAFDGLYMRLDELVGPGEPPARLHGDLWSGNVHVDTRGAPVLIDPAVYGGQREIDLAMLQLFGSPSPRLFAAYDEVHPRAPGHEERVALFQLYPLLVHVALFGAGYLGQLRSALASYA